MTKTVFIIVFSITSGGSTIEGQVDHVFATEKECVADREKLLETHRKTFPPGPGEVVSPRVV
jgi:hypothetical protein